METVSSSERQVQLEQLMPLFREQLERGNSVRFFPRGVSMLPMLRQGIDSVVLSPVPEKWKKYDLPLYQRENGKFVMHRIVAVGETITCVGDNQFALEHGLRNEQMIGIVTAFYRGEVRHSVTEPGYRLYCRLWHYTRFPRRVWRWCKRKIGRRKP